MSKWQKTLKRQGHFKKALPNANCSHCPILARFFTRRQVEIKIADKCPKSEANRCSFTRVTIAQCELSKTLSERIDQCVATPWNICHAKYPELSAIQNPAVWMSSDWKIHRWPTANERARYRAAGSSGRTFFFFLFLLSNYWCTNNVAISVNFLHKNIQNRYKKI